MVSLSNRLAMPWPQETPWPQRDRHASLAMTVLAMTVLAMTVLAKLGTREQRILLTGQIECDNFHQPKTGHVISAALRIYVVDPG